MLHRYFIDQGIIQLDDIYLNVLDRPLEFNIETMSNADKQRAEQKIIEHLQWLKNKNASQLLIKEFQSDSLFIWQHPLNDQ